MLLVHPESKAAIKLAVALRERIVKLNSQAYLLLDQHLCFFEAGDEEETDLSENAKSLLKDVKFDNIIVLGGDGLFLKAVEIGRNNKNTLISSINFGGMGFLSDNYPPKPDLILKDIYEESQELTYKLPISEAILSSEGSKKGEKLWFVNELYSGKLNNYETTYFTIFINNKRLISWKADGLLVSTAVGSTAYSLSMWGPIIWPDLDVNMIIPVHPHNIFNRPLILNKKTNMSIVMFSSHESTIHVICDGTRKYKCATKSKIAFFKSGSYVTIINRQEDSFEEKFRDRFLRGSV